MIQPRPSTIVEILTLAEHFVVPKYQRGFAWETDEAGEFFTDLETESQGSRGLFLGTLIFNISEQGNDRIIIVDGQQRLSTIVDFADDKFALGRNAAELEGKKFSELPEEQQETFYSYTVSVDVIRSADRAEILQMVRRLNAFTLPLNDQEKRHSEFFGEFKDWVNTILDRYGSIFIDWSVLTSRQIV